MPVRRAHEEVLFPRLDLVKLLRDLADDLEAGRVLDAPEASMEVRAVDLAGDPLVVRYSVEITTSPRLDLPDDTTKLGWAGYPFNSMPVMSAQWRHR